MFLLLILVPLALVLVVLSVLGLAGFGPLTDDRRSDRDGVLAAVGPAVGLLAGIGLIAVSVIGAVGLAGSGGDDRDEPDIRHRDDPAAAGPTRTTTTTRVTRTAPVRPITRRSAALGPSVTIDADEGRSFPASYDVADGLEPDTVLQITARGFAPFGRVVAEQCGLVSTAELCFNPIPAQLDADGSASFQYLVTADFVNGRAPRGACRVGAARCTVVVRAARGNARGQVQTIFGEEIPPPGSITVTPASELSLDGERVTVAVSDYPPGARVSAMLCAAPAASGPRCGAPGPSVPLVVGPDGRGTAELVITPGPVGTRQVLCSRGDECGVTVASDSVFARAPVVPITFAAPPGAAYDPMRLALGLALAAILVGIAAWLLVRTDWSAVGEAAAPEIDDAEYADLDAIIAALPPEEDELVSAT